MRSAEKILRRVDHQHGMKTKLNTNISVLKRLKESKSRVIPMLTFQKEFRHWKILEEQPVMFFIQHIDLSEWRKTQKCQRFTTTTRTKVSKLQSNQPKPRTRLNNGPMEEVTSKELQPSFQSRPKNYQLNTISSLQLSKESISSLMVSD